MAGLGFAKSVTIRSAFPTYNAGMVGEALPTSAAGALGEILRTRQAGMPEENARLATARRRKRFTTTDAQSALRRQREDGCKNQGTLAALGNRLSLRKVYERGEKYGRVCSSSARTLLALCGIGHTMVAGCSCYSQRLTCVLTRERRKSPRRRCFSGHTRGLG